MACLDWMAASMRAVTSEKIGHSSPLNAFSLLQGGDASLEGFNEGLNSILDKGEKHLCSYLFAANNGLCVVYIAYLSVSILVGDSLNSHIGVGVISVGCVHG